MPTWRNFSKGTSPQFPDTSRACLILVSSLQIQLLHFLQQFKAKVLARSKDKLPTTTWIWLFREGSAGSLEPSSWQSPSLTTRRFICASGSSGNAPSMSLKGQSHWCWASIQLPELVQGLWFYPGSLWSRTDVVGFDELNPFITDFLIGDVAHFFAFVNR